MQWMRDSVGSRANQRCEAEMAQIFATVVPVSMTLNPIDAARQLRPYVAPMFPNAWLPDILTNS